MPHNAVQVYLQHLWLERKPAGTPWAYVVTMARGSASDRCQVWIASPSFRLAVPRGREPALAFGWDGAGRLVYSLPLDALDAIELQVLVLRDKTRARDAGAFLEQLLGDEGEGKDVLDALRGGDGVVLKALDTALGAVNTANTVLELSGAVVNVIGRVLRAQKDKVLIDASGTLPRADLLRDQPEIPGHVSALGMDWGKTSRGDAGYVHLSVRTAELRDLSAFEPMRLPEEVEARLEEALRAR